jgi:hypothetical protein
MFKIAAILGKFNQSFRGLAEGRCFERER